MKRLLLAFAIDRALDDRRWSTDQRIRLKSLFAVRRHLIPSFRGVLCPLASHVAIRRQYSAMLLMGADGHSGACPWSAFDDVHVSVPRAHRGYG